MYCSMIKYVSLRVELQSLTLFFKFFSAVSVDVEGAIYRYCRSANITLFTVSHRRSLWAFHDNVLHMDGRGDYSFGSIRHGENGEAIDIFGS